MKTLKALVVAALIAVTLILAPGSGAQTISMTVDASKTGTPISRNLYGIFTEFLPNMYDGGLIEFFQGGDSVQVVHRNPRQAAPVHPMPRPGPRRQPSCCQPSPRSSSKFARRFQWSLSFRHLWSLFSGQMNPVNHHARIYGADFEGVFACDQCP